MENKMENRVRCFQWNNFGSASTGSSVLDGYIMELIPIVTRSAGSIERSPNPICIYTLNGLFLTTLDAWSSARILEVPGSDPHFSLWPSSEPPSVPLPFSSTTAKNSGQCLSDPPFLSRQFEHWPMDTGMIWYSRQHFTIECQQFYKKAYLLTYLTYIQQLRCCPILPGLFIHQGAQYITMKTPSWQFQQNSYINNHFCNIFVFYFF